MNGELWRNPIFLAALIPSIIAGLIALGVAFVENESVKISGQNDLLQMEQEKILEFSNLPKNKRLSLFCELHHFNLLAHEVTSEKIKSAISNDPGCTADGYIPETKDAPASLITITVDTCVENSSLATASCRAYDKSGFHSRPSASCSLTLKAEEGRFFAQKKVAVLSESYRNLNGYQRAIDAVSPSERDNGVIRSFSGNIACTNDKGTGRTCEANATVRAISYPDSCLDLSKELENITLEERQKILNHKDSQTVSIG